MSFKNTLEILNNQAEEVLRITEELQRADSIHIIDIHVLLDKLRDIYDLANDIQSSIPHTDPVKKGDKKMVAPDDTPLEVENTNRVREETNSPVAQAKVSEGSPETTTDRKDMGDDPSAVSGQFDSANKTLNEEISQKTGKKDISSQFITSPISSITSGLGINDKFELINELFNGDKQKFDQVVKTLNGAGSFVEAFNYLESNFSWDMENPYVQRLLELIRRKLIVKRNEQ